MIMQLIRDNLTLWNEGEENSSEEEEEEEEEEAES